MTYVWEGRQGSEGDAEVVGAVGEVRQVGGVVGGSGGPTSLVDGGEVSRHQLTGQSHLSLLTL